MPIAPVPEQVPEPALPEQAEVLPGQASPLAGSNETAAPGEPETSGLPDLEEPGEKPAQPDSSLRIPPILLEGDTPVSPPLTGPGQKYALGPTAPTARVGHQEAGLPEAYGTGKLLLLARDPHWLYAHWDFAPEQQRRYNARSADHHLVLRVLSGTMETLPAKEVHMHPESRHWFVHVDRAETQYAAELGYYLPQRQWVTVATSPPAVTPADRPSTDQTVRFATNLPRRQWVTVTTSPPAVTPSDKPSTDQTVRFATFPTHVPLPQLEALSKQVIPADLPPLNAAQELALTELVGPHLVGQDWVSSAGIPERGSRPAEQEISAPPAGLPAPLAGEAEILSSPMAAAAQPPAGFWFNINAELVIYGATEPGANVTIGGRPFQLRPDGTFSCRFSLPDGDHVITVSAMSAQGDLRQAELKFSRHTEHRGEVSTAPQNPSLKPPGAEAP